MPNLATQLLPTNLQRINDKSHVFIEVATPDGQQAGVLHDCVVSCNNLATIEQILIAKVIGRLTPTLLQRVNTALRAALEI